MKIPNFDTKTYKIQPAKKDVENGGVAEFNPFLERKNDHPTSDNETLTHLLKASLGTGILAMPFAFKCSGLLFGIFATVVTAFICTHCSYILVKCAHTLYIRTRRTAMNFSEVAEVAFANGPKWGRRYAKFFKVLILQSLFWTYFGTCSVYTVIIAENFKQVAEYYLGYKLPIGECIAYCLLPLIALSWVPNLKYLAPVSMVANLLMGSGLGITFYYLVADLKPVSSVPAMGTLTTIPEFISITIFAMEAIGVVMPLENQMKTPGNFVGICGVLNKGMSGVTLVYILLGFLGFLRYGSDTAASITLNLPTEEIPAQAVKIFIALAVFCTFGLQFYVCVEIGWNAIKDNFKQRPLLVNYVFRTVLVTAAVLLAVAVPTISPFIGLIGAFCFSILGLLVPVAIEFVTYWDSGFGPCNWIVFKNVIICIFGIFALVFGSKDAIHGILKQYSTPETTANVTQALHQ
ncbi:proton-coupled amino acid transporter-like protein pathetic isoform X2 [Sitodiplosis mosellana]|uniref:proton-coupled amino acid transporter-like protein pathetic isoform X2 n=1 Tax=Sitodiplosis mosellana TaxID=263140 RepID=UPI0024446D4D|nr:proton-coupled amino acid transporter-like protein pathetic isoform X2 [Sitodiplosis mosellana]